MLTFAGASTKRFFMILRNLLWVGLGSFAGGVLRYLVALYTRNHGYDGFFPWGTLTVNLAGSFLLGVFFALTMRFPLFADEMRLLLMVGLCGGFTTFSSFMQENFLLLQSGQYFAAATYMLASLAGGMLLFFLAFTAVKLLV